MFTVRREALKSARRRVRRHCRMGFWCSVLLVLRITPASSLHSELVA